MKLMFSALAALLFAAPSASAVSLCNCCTSGTAEACSKVCEAVKPVEGMCLPAVDFEGSATIGPGQNPLYDVALKSLAVNGTAREDLERFRKFLEAARRGVEKDRRLALRGFAKGAIDATAAATAARRYDDAVVNYYLGMTAYRAAFQR